MMKTRKFLVIIAIGSIIGMALVGCGSDPSVWAAIADGINSANNDFANSYSSSSETGMVYTIYNRSSKTVTLYDSTGRVTIAPYGSASARFNRSASIYDVSYSPSSLNVSQSGYTFTFTD
ncbi:MAG: hypothetical protein LBB89_09360 [Treponema sp.]|jgi:ribosomal protein S5|nr:hypothetical protein [Treponema sp.]